MTWVVCKWCANKHLLDCDTHMRARLPPFPFPSRWACAFRGHAKIDVQKIEPQNSNLHELDPDMRFVLICFSPTPPPSRRGPALSSFLTVVVTNSIFFVNNALLEVDCARSRQVMGKL
jgi:hypothetical protein